jgi:putative ABC transport system permease protein
VLERTREIGLMKALGTSRRTVSGLFIVEAAWIGFIGALLGSLVAIAAGTLLNPFISRKINFGDERLLIFKPGQVVGLIVFLVIVTTIAGLLPARKAAKLDPIEALRTE